MPQEEERRWCPWCCQHVNLSAADRQLQQVHRQLHEARVLLEQTFSRTAELQRTFYSATEELSRHHSALREHDPNLPLCHDIGTTLTALTDAHKAFSLLDPQNHITLDRLDKSSPKRRDVFIYPEPPPATEEEGEEVKEEGEDSNEKNGASMLGAEVMVRPEGDSHGDYLFLGVGDGEGGEEEGEEGAMMTKTFARLKGLMNAKAFAGRTRARLMIKRSEEAQAAAALPQHDVEKNRKHHLRLETAVKSGMLSQASSLMQIGYDPSSRNPTTGRTLLHVAACGDKFACSAARKLLRKLATHEALSAKDKKGDTALLVAVKHGRVVMAHALRNIGASVEVADKAGMTPLLIAAGSAAFNAKKGHEAFMALATQMQLEKCRPSDGYTALHIAIAEDNHNLARLLTLPQQEGRTISAYETDSEGKNCVELALAKRDLRVEWAVLLLQWGVDKDEIETRMCLSVLVEALEKLQRARIVLPASRDFVRRNQELQIFKAAEERAAAEHHKAMAAEAAAEAEQDTPAVETPLVQRLRRRKKS